MRCTADCRRETTLPPDRRPRDCATAGSRWPPPARAPPCTCPRRAAEEQDYLGRRRHDRRPNDAVSTHESISTTDCLVRPEVGNTGDLSADRRCQCRGPNSTSPSPDGLKAINPTVVKESLTDSAERPGFRLLFP